MATFDDSFIQCLAQIVTKYKSNITILIRASYVLGNMTTHHLSTWEILLKSKYFTNFLDIASMLYKNDAVVEKENKHSAKDFNCKNTEDALTKIIRLIANLLTATEIVTPDLV